MVTRQHCVKAAIGVLAGGVLAVSTILPAVAVTPDNGAATGGETTSLDNPVTVGTSFDAVSAGVGFSMGLGNDGKLYTWGSNSEGQLGNGSVSIDDVVYPEALDIPQTFASVDAGGTHALGLDQYGEVYSWGSNIFGELGRTVGAESIPELVDFPTTGAIVPVTPFVKVSAGVGTSFAIDSAGQLWAWGNNTSGQLGDGSTTSANVPTPVGDPLTFTDVSAGFGFHTLGIVYDALTDTSMAYVWGDNAWGQLGLGYTGGIDVLSPTPNSATYGYETVSAGASHSAAIREDGVVFTWGGNYFGELGHSPSSSVVDVPLEVFPELQASSVSAGYAFTVATASGDVYAWGKNDLGQLGNDDIGVNQSTPVLAMNPGVDFWNASAGAEHVLGTASSEGTFAWGSANSGKLGNGADSGDYDLPQVITDVTLTDVTFGGVSATDVAPDGATWSMTTPAGVAGSTVRVEAMWSQFGQAWAPISDGDFTYNVVAPVITLNPLSTEGTKGASYTMTVAATGDPQPTISNWEQSTDGGLTWQPILGATSTELTVTIMESPVMYRATFSAAGSADVTTTAATISMTAVTPTPTPTNGGGKGKGSLANTGSDVDYGPWAVGAGALVMFGAAFAAMSRRRKKA